MNTPPIHKTKIYLRSRSLGNKNYKLTRKQQQQLELEIQERKQELNEGYSSDSSDRYQDQPEQTNSKGYLFIPQFGKYHNLKQILSFNNRIINSLNNEETQSLPEKSNQNSLIESKGPQFRIDDSNTKKIYEQNYGLNFSEDSLQLEALFYQLKHQSLKVLQYQPTTYLVFWQLNGLIILEDEKVKGIFKLINDAPQQKPALDLFLKKSESEGLKEEAQKLILRRLKKIDKIEQKGEGIFNYQLAIDDYLMYQNLFRDKEQQIYECISKNKYGKNNICIGYLRFVFYEVIENKPFFIRLPIGQFNDQQVVQQESFKIDDLFLEENQLVKFTKKSKTMHSEILLFIWIAQNKQQLANLLTQQLNEKYANNFQMPSQLYLKEVYLEITSEKRVCQECVDTFPNFPTRQISDDIAAKMISNLFTVQVCFDFRLVIVSQYLFIQKGVKKEQKPVQCKGNYALPNNKEIIYFEMDHYVGIMTKEYLIKRYMSSSQKQSLFTQRLDCIKPINTFFLSQFIEDSQNSSYISSKKVVKSQITLNKLENANIYIPLTKAMSQIKWNFQFQMLQQQALTDIQQQQTLLCYQLIKILIEKPISHQELFYLISPVFLQPLIRQMAIKGIFWNIQKQWHYLTILADNHQIYKESLQSQYSISQEDFMGRKHLYDFGNINVETLLFDYYFMIKNSSSQSFNIKQVDQNQPNLTNNYGLFKINLILQDSHQQVSQEVLDIQMSKINNDFFIQLTQQFQQRQNQLQQYEIKIIQVLCFIITMQQLSKEYKQQMEQQLHLGIQIELYYQYFRKRLPLSEEVYKNEQQNLVFDTKNLETRYSKVNANIQVPLIDMDSNTQMHLIQFDQEPFQENQQLEQQDQ